MGFNAHLTLIYTGDLTKEKASEIEELLLTVDPGFHHFMGVRQEIKMFGSHNSIPVVTVMVPNQIIELRKYLLNNGIPSPSEFDWTPHVTLDLETSSTIRLPLGMMFDELGIY